MDYQQYIQRYKEKIMREEQAKQEYTDQMKSKCLDAARKYFTVNTLGAFGTALIETSNDGFWNISENRGNVVLYISFTHEEITINGKMIIYFRVKNLAGEFGVDSGNTPIIKFDYYYDENGNGHDIESYVRGDMSADDLGDLFYKLVESVKYLQRRAARELENEKINALYFGNFDTIARADAAYNERVARFPDLQPNIKDKFDQRVNEIVAVQKAEAESELQRQVEERRIAVLSAYADSAWESHPFTAYEIKYGAGTESDSDDDSRFFTESIFCLSDKRDDKGFYTSYENGTTVRIFPVNIISIREFMVTSKTNCPRQFFRHVEISDGEVSIWRPFPPAEIFQIDPVYLQLAEIKRDENTQDYDY